MPFWFVDSVDNPGPTAVFIDPEFNSPPSPGMRTCEGDQYQLEFIGDVEPGVVAIARVAVAIPATPRVIHGLFRLPCTSDTQVAVVWIDNDGNGWLLESLSFKTGDRTNFNPALDPPQFREMPYFQGAYVTPDILGNSNYPPNIIPALTAPFASDGSLQLPLTIDPTMYTQFQQGGYVDFIITTGGGATDLIVYLQF